MGDFFRFLIRVSAFLRKEIVEILRQPRLIATLVLGPFLILLLFGIGYRNQAPALETIFVVEEESPLRERITEYATSLGPQLTFRDVVSDEALAFQMLREGEVDLVAVVPEDAYETIVNNEQAVFLLYHNEISPFQVDYVRYFGKVYIDEVNRRILQTITAQSQDEALTTREDIAAARASAERLEAALDQGDLTTAAQEKQELDRRLDALELTIGGTLDLLEGVQETLGPGAPDTGEARASLTALREEEAEIGEIGERPLEEQAAQANTIEERLGLLDSQLGEFNRIEPRVLVSPFTSETRSIAELQPLLSHYFAPAVIVLLLQHLAVTFASLSIVREVQSGTIELFRVSPISAGETLLGKYLSYFLFGSVIAAILTALIVFLLGVPMLGSWLDYAVVTAALLFTSLGYGFVISLIVKTDTQAVQYAMIILLTTVFFSGFFLSLDTLWAPVRTVSWLMPATYAIQMLQDILLRGNPLDPPLLLVLLAIGILLYIIAWLLLKQTMRHT